MAKKKSNNKKASVKKLTKAKPAKKPIKKAAAKKKTNKPKKGNDTVDLECFLSTACIQHKRLPDQCEELQVLRTFRDKYMRSSPLGNQLVEDYYRLGPGLVAAIETDGNKASTYRYIYGCIKKACAKIVSLENAEAQNIYTRMVKRLTKKYSTAL